MLSSASRSRSKLSSAMSASDTGDCASPLVQFFSGVLNIESASAPASRTLAWSRAACRCRSTSLAGNSQALYADGRRVGAVTEHEIVGRHEALEDLREMPGDGHLAHREGRLAVLDPEARGAAAVIAGDEVDAHADQAGDVKTVLDLRDQLFRRFCSGGEMQVGGARGGGGRYPAVGVSRRLQAEF